MAEILEFIAAIIAINIYGTEDNPRHPFWRNSLRVFVFGGAIVAAANILSVSGELKIPMGFVLIGMFANAIVLIAEFECGNRWIGGAAVLCFVFLIATVLWPEATI